MGMKKVFYPFDGNSGIGDYVICAGLCPEVAKKYNCKVEFYCHESLKRFGLNYDDVKTIYLSDNHFESIRNQIEKGETKEYIYAWFKRDEKGTWIRGNDVNFADEFKKYVFDLPIDCEVHTPVIDQEIIKCPGQRDSIRDLEKTVIIAPYSYSNQKFSQDLLESGWWVGLVDALRNLGLLVYTNIKDDSELPIEGSVPISPDCEELVFLAKKSRAFIGMRMGLLDLLTVLGANVICISNMGLYHYDLKSMFPTSKSTTFYLCWKFMNELTAGIKINDRENEIIKALGLQISYILSVDGARKDSCKLCYSFDQLKSDVISHVRCIDKYDK